MLTLLKWIAVGLVVVGLVSGVIEVRFHSERLSGVSQQARDLVGDGSLLAQLRVWATQSKRWVEQWMIKDSEQKLTIALGYVASDAEQLSKTLDASADKPTQVLPYAELLLASMVRVDELMADAGAAELAAVRSEAEAAAQAASASLQQLQKLAAQQNDLSEAFSKTTAALKERITNLNPDLPQSEGGDQLNSVSPLPSPTPEPVIPLEF